MPGPLAIGGWMKTTLADFPGRVASGVFFQGCNFRCGYCHNPRFVPAGEGSFEEEQVLAFLEHRRGLVDGLCASGGEPLLQEGLAGFLRRVRRRTGAAVMLDTNGSLPDRLAALLEEGLLDYVALDIKGPPAAYPAITGWEGEPARVAESLEALRGSGVAFELRTTVAPGLIGAGELEAICRWVGGAGRYVLRQFRPQVTLDPLWNRRPPWPAEALHELANLCRPHFTTVEARGI